MRISDWSSDVCSSDLFTTVTRKARVLPVPVCAWPATSRPGRVIGRVNAWIGVQRVNPAASRPASNDGCSSKEEKEMSVRGLSLMRQIKSARQCALAGGGVAAQTAGTGWEKTEEARVGNGGGKA